MTHPTRIPAQLLVLPLFAGLVAFAYVAGRHLIPESAVDAVLVWLVGLLHLPVDAALLVG
jgi:hypothetical protein